VRGEIGGAGEADLGREVRGVMGPRLRLFVLGELGGGPEYINKIKNDIIIRVEGSGEEWRVEGGGKESGEWRGEWRGGTEGCEFTREFKP